MGIWAELGCNFYLHARRYMPEISINRALMDTLSEAEREDWVAATPSRPEAPPVFRYNAITKQVCAGVPSAPSGPVSMHVARIARAPGVRALGSLRQGMRSAKSTASQPLNLSMVSS